MRIKYAMQFALIARIGVGSKNISKKKQLNDFLNKIIISHLNFAFNKRAAWKFFSEG